MCQFHKHFTSIYYSHSKKSQNNLKTLLVSTLAKDNSVAYFDRSVRYVHKMIMKITT